MKIILRFFLAVFCAVTLAAAGPLPALAAPSRTYRIDDRVANNVAVAELAGRLMDKYAVDIFYPTEGTGQEQLALITPETLETLDSALETVTPALVRQVSAYCYEQTGRRLSYNYVYADMRGPYGDAPVNKDVTVGSYFTRTSRIEIFIPAHEGEAIATGDNPLTLVHEFAHAFQDFVAGSYGYYGLEKAWLGLMEGSAFGGETINTKVFITQYASASFDEDFAETFAHAFICNRPGLGIAHRLYMSKDVFTPLGKKVGFIERLIAVYAQNNAEVLSNYRKIYTTPASVNEDGLRLSGQHLLFIGMDEPRTVPLMLLKKLYVSEPQTVWFSNIGGWYCKDQNGDDLVLFPEGTYGDPGKDLLEEAIRQSEEDRNALQAAAGTALR